MSALLAAAAAVFVERGYEGATMTEIAAQAGASIGSLYQFFPTKPLIAEALHVQELDALSSVIAGLFGAAVRRPGRLPGGASGVPCDGRAAGHRPGPQGPNRRTMLEQIGALLAAASPRPDPARREAVSVLLLTLMKAAVSLRAAQEDTVAARELATELRTMAVSHFEKVALL